MLGSHWWAALTKLGPNCAHASHRVCAALPVWHPQPPPFLLPTLASLLPLRLQPADREIVHSNNFNRYLTAFRAEWDPKDPAERLSVCGR